MVVFSSTDTTVIIGGKEYMKGDVFPKVSGPGIAFYSKDPIRLVQNWVRFNNAIDGATGQPFEDIESFEAWVDANVFLPGETGISPDVQAELDKKVAKAGDTVEGRLLFSDPVNRSKIILTKFPDGTGHNNAPTSFDLNSVYLHLGGTEYNQNSYRLIGFGYRHFQDTSHAAAVVGYQETDSDGQDKGRLIFATRDVTTDTAPTVRLTIEPNGDIVAQSGARFSGDGSGLTGITQDQIDGLVSDLGEKLSATQAAAQADSEATDVAGLVADFNALLGKLRTAGILGS